jgi:hypothetical protein
LLAMDGTHHFAYANQAQSLQRTIAARGRHEIVGGRASNSSGGGWCEPAGAKDRYPVGHHTASSMS